MAIDSVLNIFQFEPLEFGEFSDELDCAMATHRRLFYVTRLLLALVDEHDHSGLGGMNELENSGADALPTVEAEEGGGQNGRPEGTAG